MKRVFDFLRTDDVPRLARRNYVIELRHLCMWGLFSGVVEGNTSAIIASKTFGGSQLLVTTVWAIPMLANMLSIVWGALARGRPRLRSYMLLAACAIVSMGSIAVTPSEPLWGGWLFAGQLLATRLFLAGVITVRTSIWNANYPAEQRARLVGRLQSLRLLLGLMIVAGVSSLFDLHAQYYRFVYPVTALIGVVSLFLLRGLRVRGQAAELARWRREQEAAAASGGGGERNFAASLREALLILKRDRAFASYCAAQFFLGSAIFLIEPALNITLTQTLKFGYFLSSGLMDILPTLLMLIAIRFWAPYFDRVGVVQFRVLSSIVWVAAFATTAVSMFIVQLDTTRQWLPIAIGVLFLARIMAGIGRGGGAIAWHIGHLHFAGRDNAELYMGVHMALTGVRGLLMPFVSLGLNAWVGNLSFGVAVVSGTIGAALFWRLARADRRSALQAEAHAKEASRLAPRSDVT